MRVERILCNRGAASGVGEDGVEPCAVFHVWLDPSKPVCVGRAVRVVCPISAEIVEEVVGAGVVDSM